MRYGPRLEYPGSLHHVMCRSVDGCAPFKDMEAASIFMESLGVGSEKAGLSILAWAIMPNHVHLLVRCNEEPLSTAMRSALVRFAVIHNRMMHRRGHLFQGKFKSILVEEGRYLLELVRYIHLNPLRAGLVSTIEGLADYPLTGHRGVMSGKPEKWHDTEALLSLFSKNTEDSAVAYFRHVASTDRQEEAELLFYSTGSWLLGKTGLVRPEGDPLSSRRYECWGAILGSKEYALEHVKQLNSRGRSQVRKRESMAEVLLSISEALETPQAVLQSGSKTQHVSRARRLAARHLVEHHGLTVSETARILRQTPSAVSKMLARARESEMSESYSTLCARLGPDVKTDPSADPAMGAGG